MKKKSFLSKIFDKSHRSRTISYLIVIAAFIIIQTLGATVGLKRSITTLLVPTCCYIIAALALNLVVGVSGELSLGHAGFMAIGAYVGVTVTTVLGYYTGSVILRVAAAVIIGSLCAALVGFLISVPVLKLQGDYLAVVTLAFGQIIRTIFNNVYLGYDSDGLHFSFVTNNVTIKSGGEMILQGAMGTSGAEKLSTFTCGFILILIALFIIYNLMYSKHGRAIMAARDNRIAAQSVGISVTQIKTLAFVVSAAIAGMAGVLYGLNYSTIQPAKFDFNTSILILVYVVLGGLGNITGTIISTTVLYVLPEMLRSLQDYRMIIYAVVLIIIMLVTNNAGLKERITKLLPKKKVKGADSND